MALVYADRVLETTTSTGTGTINLGGAKSGGYQTFVAGVGSANTCYYCIVDDANDAWEIGVGTVIDAATDQLTRTTVIQSSNADALVNFASGTKDVFTVAPATKVNEWFFPETGDPDYSSVAVLLSMDGANGGTTFTDSGPDALSISVINGTNTDTTQKKFGTASAFFDGTTDGLTFSKTGFDFLTSVTTEDQSFTVEAWVYFNNFTNYNCIMQHGENRTDWDSFTFITNITTGTLYAGISGDGGSFGVSATTACSTGTWHHVAVTYDASIDQLALYLDGTREGTANKNTGVTYGVPTTDPKVGCYIASNNFSLNGYMDDFRISKTVRYSGATYAVPTAAHPTSTGVVYPWWDMGANNVLFDNGYGLVSDAGGQLKTGPGGFTWGGTAGSNSASGLTARDNTGADLTVLTAGNGLGGWASYFVDNARTGRLVEIDHTNDSFTFAKSTGTGNVDWTCTTFDITASGAGVIAFTGTLGLSASSIDFAGSNLLIDNGKGFTSDAGGFIGTGAGGATWQTKPGSNASASFVASDNAGLDYVHLVEGDGASGWISFFFDSTRLDYLLHIDHINDTVTFGTDVTIGTGSNILGDFDNATIANRTRIQTTGTNANTRLGITPSGTGVGSYLILYSDNDQTNTHALNLYADASGCLIHSASAGTGTLRPLILRMNATDALTIETDGASTFGGDIRGDFSNATVNDRIGFRSSTVNGGTFVTARPNGTGIQSGFTAIDASTQTNAAGISMYTEGVSGIIQTQKWGTGTSTPISFRPDGFEALNLGLDLTATFSGDINIQANDFIGDFNSVSAPNVRAAFVSNTLNTGTVVQAEPNGTGDGSYFVAYEDPGGENTQFAGIGCDADSARIFSGITGTGTQKPLTFRIGSTNRFQIETDGTLSSLNATYETLVTADDDIPNKKYVDDAIAAGGGGLSNVVEDTTPQAGGDFDFQQFNINGDFTDANVANRTQIVTNVTNGKTGIPILPNGTGDGGAITFYEDSTTTNSPFFTFGNNSTEAYLISGRLGAGTFRPMAFYTNETKQVEIGTDGVTTFSGAIDLQGNNILGDFDNATVSNRSFVQTRTLNQPTSFFARPNGTATQSGMGAFGGTDVDNAPYVAVIHNGTVANIDSGKTGTGTATVMTFSVGGTEGFRIDTESKFTLREISTFTTPATGYGTIYVKSSDSKLYFKNDGGAEWDLTAAGGISNVVEDTTPQLGGDLDTQQFDLTGDFDNATVSSRTMFKTTTLNTPTSVFAKPNGTSTQSGIGGFGGSDVDNSPYVTIYNDGTGAYLSSSKTGTGTTTPIYIALEGTSVLTIPVTGAVKSIRDITTEKADAVLLANATTGTPVFRMQENGTTKYQTYWNPGDGTARLQVLDDTVTYDQASIVIGEDGTIEFWSGGTGVANSTLAATVEANGNTTFNGSIDVAGGDLYLSNNDGANEGGQITFQGWGATYTNPSYIDRFQNSLRFIHNTTVLFQIEGDGTLNVVGTTNYETLVTADDDIPNKKYVDDAIAAGGGGISNVVEDLTPQLGGHLDVNGKYITSATNGNVILWPDGTGVIQSLSQHQFSAGTAGAPGISFTADTDTGLYHQGSALSMGWGASEKQRWDADSINFYDQVQMPAGSAADMSLVSTGDGNTGIFWLGSDRLAFGTNATERLRVDASGRLITGGGTSVVYGADAGSMVVSSGTSGIAAFAVSTSADDLVIENSTHVGLTLASPNTATANIYFADPEDTDNAYITYSHATGIMQLYANATQSMSWDSTRVQAYTDVRIRGNDLEVGYFAQTATANMTLGPNRGGFGASQIEFITDNTTYTTYGFRINRASGVNAQTDLIHRGTADLLFQTTEAADIVFKTNNTERFHIESDGTLSANHATYETLVTADDDIPNKKYVDDAIGKDLGEFTVATLPSASTHANYWALATDASGGRTIVRSDGTNWKVVAVEGATVST